MRYQLFKSIIVVALLSCFVVIGLWAAYRDSVSEDVYKYHINEVLNEVIAKKNAGKYSNEFQENWVFASANRIQIYTDFDLLITDKRVQIYKPNDLLSHNTSSLALYAKNTLIVRVYKPERDSSNYQDEYEISYAWGPLAAHGIGLKVEGNRLMGFKLRIMHRWIS